MCRGLPVQCSHRLLCFDSWPPTCETNGGTAGRRKRQATGPASRLSSFVSWWTVMRGMHTTGSLPLGKLVTASNSFLHHDSYITFNLESKSTSLAKGCSSYFTPERRKSREDSSEGFKRKIGNTGWSTAGRSQTYRNPRRRSKVLSLHVMCGFWVLILKTQLVKRPHWEEKISFLSLFFIGKGVFSISTFWFSLLDIHPPDHLPTLLYPSNSMPPFSVSLENKQEGKGTHTQNSQNHKR